MGRRKRKVCRTKRAGKVYKSNRTEGVRLKSIRLASVGFLSGALSTEGKWQNNEFTYRSRRQIRNDSEAINSL